MQPLPRDITASVFMQASQHLTTAAGNLKGPDAASLLYSGAREIYQGLPSLRMTTTGTRELAAQLDQAAHGALALSKQLLTGTVSLAGSKDTVLGWAHLADEAAGAVAPVPPIGW